MAHGITLYLRHIRPPAPVFVHQHPTVGTGAFARVVPTTYSGPSRDRSLPGKARRRARKAGSAR